MEGHGEPGGLVPAGENLDGGIEEKRERGKEGKRGRGEEGKREDTFSFIVDHPSACLCHSQSPYRVPRLDDQPLVGKLPGLSICRSK